MDDLVRQVLEDPDSAVYLLEVRTPEFFDKFIQHCLSVAIANPAEGLLCLDVALRIVTCAWQHGLVLGMRASCLRALKEPETALAELDSAFRVVRDCPSSRADLLRRRALVKRDLCMFDAAMADAAKAAELYRSLPAELDRDLDGNGLAKAVLGLGQVEYEAGLAYKSPHLLSASAEHIAEALGLTNPRVSAGLHGRAVFNLGVALHATGRREDLLTADHHIRTARQYFARRKHEPSSECAKLDWATGMVRFELRIRHGVKTDKPSQLIVMLRRSLEDFLYLGMPQESVAVATDLARVAFPCRDEIRQIVRDMTSRVEQRWEELKPEVRQRFEPVSEALEAVRRAADRRVRSMAPAGVDTVAEVQEGLKASIERLRERCGDKVLPCLISWPSAD